MRILWQRGPHAKGVTSSSLHGSSARLIFIRSAALASFDLLRASVASSVSLLLLCASWPPPPLASSSDCCSSDIPEDCCCTMARQVFHISPNSSPSPHKEEPEPFFYVVFFIAAATFLATITYYRLFSKKRVSPFYASAMFWIGVFMAYQRYKVLGSREKLSTKNPLMIISRMVFYTYSNITERMLILLILPPTLFVTSLEFDFKLLKRCLLPSFLWALVKVPLYTYAIGGTIKLMGYGWSFSTSLFIGATFATTGIRSAITPKDADILKMFLTVLEFSAFIAIGPQSIISCYFESHISHDTVPFLELLKSYVIFIFGGVAAGIACWIVPVWVWIWWRSTCDDFHQQVFMSISIFAVYTAIGVELVFGVSSIFAVSTLGILFRVSGMLDDVEVEDADTFKDKWALLSHVGNTISYILSGILVTMIFLDNEYEFKASYDVWRIVVLYVAIYSLKVIVVLCLLGIAKCFGYQLTLLDSVILALSEIEGEGAIFTILSTNAFHMITSDYKRIFSHAKRAELLFLVGGVIGVMSTFNTVLTPLLAKLRARHANSQRS